ncbi:uncharacterized protein LOC117299718 [Asterias rubens]|uniref:uncharacterized protein LOC117299718 n=1 Tax=Asterias rubens TaxID=7604 RepID=UPI001455025F|nr:uncharacterized protein LOC117299718 [Asterias rubens]
MKNLVLLLLLVCTLHGICVSLECYKCTFSDEGCQDLSLSAPPGLETCADGSICHVTRLTLANGDVVDAERGCIPDSDCYNGCSGFLDESPECTSCCIEDRCNSGVPIFEDVSCYECYNIHLITGGDGPSACDYPFNPHDVSVGTTTCYSGHCAVYYQKGSSKNTVVYRGCPDLELKCRSTKTQCKGSECIDCCSGNLCNGQVTARSLDSIEQSTASVANNKQATNNVSSNGHTINVASYGRNICVISLASIWLNWFINNWHNITLI